MSFNRLFLAVSLLVAGLASGCVQECVADGDCDATVDRCALADDGSGTGVCVPKNDLVVTDEGEGEEGEGEGDEGEGEGEEGEGEGELIIDRVVVDVDGTPTNVAPGGTFDVVYNAAVAISVTAEANEGAPTCQLNRGAPQLDRDAPSTATLDEVITIECALSGAVSVEATLRLLPLAAVLKEPAPVFAVGEEPAAASLVTTTTVSVDEVPIDCVFDEQLAQDRSGVTGVTCSRGLQTVTVRPVAVSVAAAISATSLRLDAAGSAVVIDVDQRGAESCALACSPTGTFSVDASSNGVVSLTVPALSEGISSCVVSCAGGGGVPATASAIEIATASDGIRTVGELGSLASSVRALVGALSIVGSNLTSAVEHTGLEVVAGKVEFSDTTDGANSVTLSFPLLRDVRSFSVTEMPDLLSLSDVDGVGATIDPSFPALREVREDLVVSDNLVLANLGSATDAAGAGALPSLSTVSGTLTVSSNASLASLALPSLSTVSGGVDISTNALLLAAGLTSLTRIGSAASTGGLTFSANATGATAGQTLVVSLKATPPLVRVFGAVTVINNRRASDQDLRDMLVSKLDNSGFSAPLVANNAD